MGISGPIFSMGFMAPTVVLAANGGGALPKAISPPQSSLQPDANLSQGIIQQNAGRLRPVPADTARVLIRQATPANPIRPPLTGLAASIALSLRPTVAHAYSAMDTGVAVSLSVDANIVNLILLLSVEVLFGLPALGFFYRKIREALRKPANQEQAAQVSVPETRSLWKRFVAGLAFIRDVFVPLLAIVSLGTSWRSWGYAIPIYAIVLSGRSWWLRLRTGERTKPEGTT